jgi:hypothetical protein
LTVKAAYSNNGLRISATLHFNEKGELVNFVSDDRPLTTAGKSYRRVRWSIPVGSYGDFNGLRLPSHAEAVWHLPEGDYCYGKFGVKEIEYNRKTFR